MKMVAPVRMRLLEHNQKEHTLLRVLAARSAATHACVDWIVKGVQHANCDLFLGELAEIAQVRPGRQSA